MSMDEQNPQTPKRAGEVWVRRESEKVAVYVPEAGQLHALNASALAIWELCDGTTTVDEMVRAIVELTDAEPSEAERDVVRTLNELADRGLVE